jgi:hypothetical protein
VFPFRSPTPHLSLWERFRTSAEGFTITEEEGYWTFHVVAGEERMVDLFLALVAELPAAVSVEVSDRHAKRAWKASGCPRDAARDVLAPLRAPLLGAHGGVELTVYGADDQITLNPMLEIFIYSHSDRWAHVLQGKELEERRLVRTRSWKVRSHGAPPAPELSAAVAAAVRVLGLAPAS